MSVQMCLTMCFRNKGRIKDEKVFTCYYVNRSCSGWYNICHQRNQHHCQITATVVDIQQEWESSADPDDPDRLVDTAYIDYEVDGKKYEHVLAPEQNGNMKVGDTVDILVQSQNPEKISALNPTKGGIIFIVVGVIAAIGGCVSTIRAFIKRR